MSTQLAVKPKLMPLQADEKTAYDLIIIGGGPAGLAAAIYAGRARLKTALIEKMIVGGQASTTFQIENYPGFPESISGMDLSQKMAEQAVKLGLAMVWGSAVSVKKGFEAAVDGKVYHARSVIVATGTENSRLNVPGEDQLRGRGVSYCATCDGAFYQNKHVMVVGGGNSAIEEALFLTRYASRVSIVHRRDELRADKILAERARSHPKIYFFWHSVVEEIKGKQKVEEVTLKDLTSDKKLHVPVDGIFVYVGSRPNSDPVKDLVKLDEKGYILTDEKMATATAGLFAAGDVRVKHLRQVVTAVSDGAIAAESAREFVEKT